MTSEKYEHKIPGQFRHEDMLLSDNIPLENVLRVQELELEPSDVVVASYPKTGTTMLQEIVWLIRNNGDVEEANKTINVARVPYMELKWKDGFKTFADLPHPRHMKTHLPYRYLPISAREGKAKVVYILRNPKDCLVSYYHFHRMNASLGNFKGTWNDFFDYFRKNGFILTCGNPFDHMVGYWEHRNEENLHIVSFEDLINDRKSTIAKIADFLECPLSDEAIEKIVNGTKFDVMKANPMTNMDFGPTVALNHSISPFMRKGQIGDWKNYFTEDQNTIMDQMEKEKLAGTDLKFVYN